MAKWFDGRRQCRTMGNVWLAALLLGGAPTRARAADPPSAGGAPPRIEVVFVLDTTGSMGGLLQAAKEQIWSIVTDLACARPAPELRLGLVAYRDRDDAYVTRRFDLTSDMDGLYTELVGLQADGGGDRPESVNQGLYEAVTRIDWSTDPHTYRVIFLIGDAPPHMEYRADISYLQSCQLAHQRGIAVNTIQCGADDVTTRVWTDIAQRGDGAFARLVESGAASTIATPYDKGIATMARQLDGTRLPYGTDAERAAFAERRERSEQIYEHGSLAAQAGRGVFNASPTGRRSVYGDKDLLADWQRGLVSLDAIDPEQLPEPLRSMSPSERSAYLARQAKLREDLELTLASVAEERRRYLASQEAGRGGGRESLTSRVSAVIQPQAARFGFELGSCAAGGPPTH